MTNEDKQWITTIYKSILDPFLDSNIEGIELDNRKTPSLIDKTSHPDMEFIDKSIIRFYSFFNWWKFHWVTTDHFKFKAEGTFEFTEFKNLLVNQDEDNGANDWALDMKGFRSLDNFYDSNGFVGFFINRPDKKGLYLIHSDSSMSALNVDFEGYLKLLAMSKGFGWWQNALVQISTGEHQPNVDSFKEKMPQIFSNFNWDEFVETYESLRIDK